MDVEDLDDSSVVSEDGESVVDEQTILYDLKVHNEWPPEVKSDNEKLHPSLASRVAHSSSRSFWTFLRSAGIRQRLASPCTLPGKFVKLMNSQFGWKFAVSSDGELAAVLTSTHLELRSRDDEFSGAFSRCPLPRDSHTQWRRLVWSPDCCFVAVALSSGAIVCVDLSGSVICNIGSHSPSTEESPVDLSQSAAALMFIPIGGTDYNNQFRLISVTYGGCLTSYLLDWEKGSFTLDHTFSFTYFYPGGVTCAEYSHTHSLLFVGGASVNAKSGGNPSMAACEGVSVWRVLPEPPYYIRVTSLQDDQSPEASQAAYLLKARRVLKTMWGVDTSDQVVCLRLSPSGQRLTSVSVSSKVCIWTVPNLKLIKSWTHDQQPDHDLLNPDTDNNRRSKVMKEMPFYYHVVDVQWWSEECLALARFSGAVTVSKTENLTNLLGDSPEWFEPATMLSPTIDKAFLVLECEVKQVSSRPPPVENSDGTEDTEEEEEPESTGLTSYFMSYVKRVLFHLTDMESLRPPQKKRRLLRKVHKLISLKSITPQELFERKIDHGEYGEALALTKVYDLDSDLVYQRQWKLCQVSRATINDYLSKVSKLSWVLYECTERMPTSLDATRHLLQYGMKITSLDALIKAGDVYLPNDTEDTGESDSDSETDSGEDKKQEALLKKINFSDLTLQQREMCRARQKLQQCFDRLDTYEEILGGIYEADEKFESSFFEKFRYQNIVEACAQFAQESNVTGLDCVFTYLGTEVLSHRLAILSNFPETCPPSLYQSLLPGLDARSGRVVQWEQRSLRKPDWCELPECRNAVDPAIPQLGDFLYRDDPSLQPFDGVGETSEVISSWYKIRAMQIEKESRLVDYSMELLSLGQKCHVQGLEELYNDLQTMDTLVYEAQVADTFLFSELLKMDDIDKLTLLMSQSKPEMYTKNLYRWLLPFLQRCEVCHKGAHRSLLRKYLQTLALEDLTLVAEVFNVSRNELQKSKQPQVFFPDDEELLSVALDCIYGCGRDDQLDCAIDIFQCLPSELPRNPSAELKALHKEVNELDKHLDVAQLLQKHGVNIRISQVKQYQEDISSGPLLLTRLTGVASRRGNMRESDWRKLLADLLTLQETLYPTLEKSVCYEIFVEMLLKSGTKENIALAGSVMEVSCTTQIPDSRSRSPLLIEKLPYRKSVELVLKSAQDLFNSAGHFSDPCIETAKSILYLIEDSNSQVSEEIDLIASLQHLCAFGADILPIKVRLCQDKLSLITDIVLNNATAYKSHSKLLRLAWLLRVGGSSEVGREGAVLQLVVRRAMELGDFTTAFTHCSHLISVGYQGIWTECMLLAKSEAFHDNQAKRLLLEFALTHCSQECMEPLLRDLTALELQSHKEALTDQTSTTTGAFSQTKNLIKSTTSLTTQSLRRAIHSSGWWTPSSPSRGQTGPDLAMDLHVFYEGLITSNYIQLSSDQPTEDLLEAQRHLRLLSLDELLSPSTSTALDVTAEDMCRALLQCSTVAVKSDVTLSLSYLLSLHKVEAAASYFEELSEKALCYELAVYYYTLQLASYLVQENKSLMNYHHQHPASLESTISNLMVKSKRINMPEVKASVEGLSRYKELLEDLKQAHLLQGLDRGVDVGRFTADLQYKKDTIAGLAMSADESHYQTSLSLAEKYNLPVWDIHMSHVEYLFTDSSFNTTMLVKRLKVLDLGVTLRARPDEFVERMEQEVLPLLWGTDHPRLLSFYQLLQGCTFTGSETSPDQHLNMLKRITTAAPGMDYLSLMAAGEDQLPTLAKALSSTNIHVFAKIANKIPKKGGGVLSPSCIWSTWGKKFFWIEKASSTDKDSTSQNPNKWVHQYEACHDFINKMEIEDFVNFVTGIMYTDASIEKMSVQNRSEIAKRASKHCKNLVKAKPSGTSESAVKSLTLLVTHQTMMRQEPLVALQQSESERLQSYYGLLYFTQGHTDEMEQALVTMILDGQPLELVQDLLEVLPLSSWSVRHTFQGAVATICDNLRGGERSLSGQPLEVLGAIIEQVGEHQREGGQLVDAEDLMGLLRPLIADHQIEVGVRLEALKALEKNFELNEGDVVLLTLYRTEAIVSTLWPSVTLAQETVSTCSERGRLLQELLSQCEQFDQYRSLITLVNTWPGSTEKSEQWLAIFQEVLASKFCTDKQVEDFILESSEGLPLKDQHWTELCTDLRKDYILASAIIGLRTKMDNLVAAATESLQSYSGDISGNKPLCNLIIHCHCVAQLAQTRHYPVLEDHLMTTYGTQNMTTVEEVAQALETAGFPVLSGQLLLRLRKTHPALRTFNGALTAVKNWLKQ